MEAKVLEDGAGAMALLGDSQIEQVNRSLGNQPRDLWRGNILWKEAC